MASTGRPKIPEQKRQLRPAEKKWRKNKREKEHFKRALKIVCNYLQIFQKCREQMSPNTGPICSRSGLGLAGDIHSFPAKQTLKTIS